MSRTVLLALWALALAAVALCAVGSRSWRSMATLHQVRAFVTASVPRLVAALLCWAWVGWHFFAR